MTNLTPEMIEKAKTAKSAEELLDMAKESNVELTAEEAKTCFEQLNPKLGELSDDELDNVAGGCGGKDNGPQKYYDVFTNNMKVKRGNAACLAFAPNGCGEQYRGTITFTSPTTWYCTCTYCGAQFTGSGNPKDKGLHPDK